MKNIIGIHINSDVNLICSEVIRAKSLKCSLVQLFVDPLANISEYLKFSNLLQKYNMKCVVHGSYTINLCKPWDEYSWWIRQFISEIHLAHNIGAIGIIIHLGKQLSLSIEESLNNMFTSLIYIHKQTINLSNTKILIETSSGQGSELCYKFDDYCNFYSKIAYNNEFNYRFGTCLDTCHVFVAGNDIRSTDNLINFLKEIDMKLGFDNIKLIHLNDSKNDIGTFIDRHENIGYGYIGKSSLIKIIKFFSELGVPILLETPLKHQNKDMKLLYKYSLK